MALRVYLAGRVVLEGGDRVVGESSFAGRQGRLAFAYLALSDGRPISRHEFADVLWSDAPPPGWDGDLSVIISKLRTGLDRAGLGRDRLPSAFGCYQLLLPPDAWVDVLAAGEALDRAEGAVRRGSPNEAWGWILVTSFIARREFLPTEDGAWVKEVRDRLRDHLTRALEILTDIYVVTRDVPLALASAEELVALEPYRETSYQRLMRVYGLAGNRAGAVAVFERCRRLLAEDLGIAPSSETEAIFRSLTRDGLS